MFPADPNRANEEAALSNAIAAVPAGAWAVGVSGGADSVALLLLLRRRADLSLTVAHLDHELRGAESEADATFVRELADRLSVPCVSGSRSKIERGVRQLPANSSSRYRSSRLNFFREVVAAKQLRGVVLAHHADDQAETVLHRILRGSGVEGLAPMRPRTVLGGLVLLRPLLSVRRDSLRQWLVAARQSWREDSSNESDHYARNRLRKFLATQPALTQKLLHVATAAAALHDFVAQETPLLPVTFAADSLARLPVLIAREAARRWLATAGCPASELTRNSTDRLIAMASDAASPGRAAFPGNVSVRRRRGIISVIPPATFEDCKHAATHTRS